VKNSKGSPTIHLLADHPELIGSVGLLRWKEWGHPPEPVDLSWWVSTTGREAGRDKMPITFVAVDAFGAAIGAVGLGEFDIAERRDRSPWVLGMIIRPESRGLGAGRLLLFHLEQFAARSGHFQLWVATGTAVAFYQRCGWQEVERLQLASGHPATMLTKQLPTRATS
jgi:predicted N-acetyltransferase YhbS